MSDPDLTIEYAVSDELRAWLTAELRFPVLAVLDRNGRPTQSVMWFDLDPDQPDTVLLNSMTARAKVGWLKRDPSSVWAGFDSDHMTRGQTNGWICLPPIHQNRFDPSYPIVLEQDPMVLRSRHDAVEIARFLFPAGLIGMGPPGRSRNRPLAMPVGRWRTISDQRHDEHATPHPLHLRLLLGGRKPLA